MPRQQIASGSPYEELVGYSRAIVDGPWCFISGSTGLDMATGVLPDGVEEQCQNTLATIGQALTEAGFGFDDIVRVRYILPNRDDFEPCWPQLKAIFGKSRPAATMIQADLIDPAMRIEIEVTAYRPSED